MRGVELESPAKINWFLHIGSKRDDGYHELETVFQQIDLHDIIEIREAPSMSIVCSHPGVPADRENLAWRAWELMAERYGLPSVRITIHKNIPAAAGLAGGSSNAAAVLRGLTRMFEPEVDDADLAEIALTLGSDVPFFLHEGAAYGRGRGERLDPVDPPRDVPLLLLFPPEPVSTARAFSLLADMREPGKAAAFIGRDAAIALLRGPVSEMVGRTRNDLEPAAAEIAPSVARARAAAERLAGVTAVRMSGSGSTVWVAFDDREARSRAAKVLKREWTITEANIVRPA